ncbi:RNA polymerase sigma factor [Chitinophaga japonensis]|uniref:RNA polymerase sigma-70 factor (ECF subfamily) n=1 Tax=Chitinophaga japonensis TaxID=104662 RepID=A0A562TDF2_CHIJA|nr:RNA polymerase sigma-70 factor [Chitinophaga japonensis]TWI91591.1 RNA polymerase sigma-70 factor (ECF subfamily) [Chitinophaga japonensis]
MNQFNDAWLLAQLRAGDPQAFEMLFNRYFRLLWMEAYARLDNAEEAEDIVQEFFVELWEKQLYLGIQQSLKYYLYQAVRNRCINRLQHRKTAQKRLDNYIVVMPRNQLPAYRLENIELRLRLDHAIQGIPPESARVFRMMYLEHKKRKEVAAQLGISENTVKTQLARAVRYLRRYLDNFNER